MIQPHRLGSMSFSVLVVGILSTIAGCTKPLDPNYVTGAELAKQPAPYQKRARAFLEQYFGTPSRPRWYKADEKSLAAAASDEAKKTEAIKLIAVHEDEHMRLGAEIYRVRCAGCHGTSGDGNGPAAVSLNPKPRDYRQGIFKFTSTPIGAQPRRADLVRIIKNGAKGTSMPSFKFMDPDELSAVVDYITSLSQRGQLEKFFLGLSEDYAEEPDKVPAALVGQQVNQIAQRWTEAEGQVTLPPVPEPANDAESVKIGRTIFLGQECAKCHGKDGKGQLPTSLTPDEQKNSLDAWHNLSLAADVTSGMLHGGRRPIDVYRRIYWGINGTKMPAFEAQFKSDPVKVWHVVHFILAVTQGEPVDGPIVGAPAAPEKTPTPEKPAGESEAPAPNPEKPAAGPEKPATPETPATPDAGKPATPEKEKAPAEGEKPASPEKKTDESATPQPASQPE